VRLYYFLLLVAYKERRFSPEYARPDVDIEKVCRQGQMTAEEFYEVLMRRKGAKEALASWPRYVAILGPLSLLFLALSSWKGAGPGDRMLYFCFIINSSVTVPDCSFLSSALLSFPLLRLPRYYARAWPGSYLFRRHAASDGSLNLTSHGNETSKAVLASRTMGSGQLPAIFRSVLVFPGHLYQV
jgi:hypothetical protein